MNNACPTCGAVYAVAAKDVGRKIRCKKCSTSLRVEDSGLVVDTPTASAPPIPAAAAPIAAAVAVDDFDTGDEDRGRVKKPGKRATGGGGGDILAQVGGIPTILFSIGVFMVIWFTFMTPIGQAAIERARTNSDRLKMDRDAEMKKSKDDPEKVKKIGEDYAKKIEEAAKDAYETRIDNVRAKRFERYGQMFGFLFVAFGCIGYLRTQQPPVVQYVAGFILATMMLVVFTQAGGCERSSGPPESPIGGV